MLRSVDTLDQIRVAFHLIFNSNDPFGKVFCDSISERLILCPTIGYYLNQHQFEAMIRAVEAVNESRIFLSEIEGKGAFQEQLGENEYSGSHFEILIPVNYEEYTNTVLVVENALYSPTGKWGIIISHEEHAVIGGERSFMEKFKQFYPDWSGGLSSFQKMWENNAREINSDTTWIHSFLKHVNG